VTRRWRGRRVPAAEWGGGLGEGGLGEGGLGADGLGEGGLGAGGLIAGGLGRGWAGFPPGTPDSRILASLVSKGDEALERERAAGAEHEQRRRAAADRLAERPRRPDGFDYGALAEASGRWLRA
jgi:hypothetical protein